MSVYLFISLTYGSYFVLLAVFSFLTRYLYFYNLKGAIHLISKVDNIFVVRKMDALDFGAGELFTVLKVQSSK